MAALSPSDNAGPFRRLTLPVCPAAADLDRWRTDGWRLLAIAQWIFNGQTDVWLVYLERMVQSERENRDGAD